MRYNQLGRTDIKVSTLCLGSMTWGSQNTAPEAHAQIDMALDRGVNFIDTAEMYPVNPLAKETPNVFLVNGLAHQDDGRISFWPPKYRAKAI